MFRDFTTGELKRYIKDLTPPKTKGQKTVLGYAKKALAKREPRELEARPQSRRVHGDHFVNQCKNEGCLELGAELADNISVCSACGEHSNDDFETVFDENADPYHKKCLPAKS